MYHEFHNRPSRNQHQESIPKEPVRHQGKEDSRHSWNLYLASGFILCAALLTICSANIGGTVANAEYAGDATLDPTVGVIDQIRYIRLTTEGIRQTEIGQSKINSGSENVASKDTGSKAKPNSTVSSQSASRVAANAKISEQIIAHHEKATPTISKFIETFKNNPHVQFTNLSGSFGGVRAIDHESGSAADISKESIPDLEAAKVAFEKEGIIVYSHYNFSGVTAPIDAKGSHFHVVDKYWLEQRLISKFDKNYTLPSNYEDWKKEIADKIAKKAIAIGIEPKYPIAAAILESGITPEAVGDSGCSFGILQLNKCVHNKIITTDEQIDLWLKNFLEKYNRTKSWQIAVVSWNAPALASKGIWKTKYFEKYAKVLSQVES